jgi:arylsulfatase A-like enzyme/cytochrome c-type biogenesis protein CcmH/NrfG
MKDWSPRRLSRSEQQTRPRTRRASARLVLLAAIVAASCSETRQRPDILIVTLDTARADHFSYAGESPVATPNIDLLAAQGVGFLTAIAPTPITLPSHATLFTGLLPSRHGVRNNGTFRLGAEAVTLAEVLSEAGWTTAAFVGAAVLEQRYGLDQGFSLYDDRVEARGTAGLFQYPRRRGDRVVRAAVDWLSEQSPDRPTFVWVHLFDPHAPYDAPEPERSLHPESPYAAGIAFADRVVGDLLAGYRELERFDPSIVVLTADHGESLSEHGEATHGVFVYDATVRVPLVIRAPGLHQGLKVAWPVGLVDVMPTILSLAGLPPAESLDGVDLTPFLRGADGDGAQDRPLFLESRLPLLQYGWSPVVGVRTANWKLIQGVSPELYDLAQDPRELRDLATTERERVAELENLLARQPADEGTAEEMELDLETRAKLEALGYLTSRHERGDDAPGALPDPRERIAEKERMIEAMKRYTEGDHEGGIAAVRAITVGEPGNLTAWTRLGDLLSLEGRYDEAVGAFTRASELDPENGPVLANLGFCLERLDRKEEALAAYSRVVRGNPAHRRARGLRWSLLQRMGKGDAVVREARGVIAEDDRDGDAWLWLALDRRNREDVAGVVAALERALNELPGDANLTVALAAETARLGNREAAMLLYRSILGETPTHQQAAAGLGRLLLIGDQVAEALPVLEKAANTLQADPDLLLALAEARTRSGQAAAALPAALRAVALRPDRAEAWSVLGSVRLSLGTYRQAAEAYTRALEIDPDDRITAHNLATARERMALVEPVQENP